MKRLGILSLCLLLVVAPAVQAQFAVIDAANLTRNTITALQQTLNTIESVLHTGYWILELTELAELAWDDEFLNDLAILKSLAQDVQTISWDMQSIEGQVRSLFGLGAAPGTSRLLYERQQEMQQAIQAAHTQAVKTQGLLRTIVNTVEHIKRLVSKISSVAGNKAALQNINDAVTSLNKIEGNHAAMTATFQRAMVLEAMEKQLVQESSRKIQQHFCGRWCQ